MRPHFWIILAATVAFLLLERPWAPPTMYEQPFRDYWARDALQFLRNSSLYICVVTVTLAHAVCSIRSRQNPTTPYVGPPDGGPNAG
jgi:hypothetical protein